MKWVFRKKVKQVEVEIDYTDIQKGIRNAKIWMIFNAVLFFGGMAVSLVVPLIAIGVLIFCPISIIKNFRKYRKFKNYLKNSSEELVEDYPTEKIDYQEIVVDELPNYKNNQLKDEQKNNIDSEFSNEEEPK